VQGEVEEVFGKVVGQENKCVFLKPSGLFK